MKTFTIVACALLIPAAAGAQDGRINFDLLDKLAARASEKQQVDLPVELLQSTGLGLVPPGQRADAARQTLSELKGIFVRHYEFDDQKAYSMDDINTLRKQLLTPGWTRIVANEEKGRDGSWELQEIYLFQPGGKSGGIVIISAEPDELSVVNIVGPIDLERLRNLNGIFGIPRVPGFGSAPPPPPPQPAAPTPPRK